jgi:hypothetical protein
MHYALAVAIPELIGLLLTAALDFRLHRRKAWAALAATARVCTPAEFSTFVLVQLRKAGKITS